MFKFLKKKSIWAALLILLLGLGSTLYILLPKVKAHFDLKEIEQENIKAVEEAKNFLPETAFLEVPFICQAPLQTDENWKSHEESCEEAAILQAHLYINEKTMTKQVAHEEILRMENWQIEHFGSHHDIYADEVRKFILDYYKLSNNDVDIVYDATLDDIKKYISSGYPVIVPIMGNILNNPYYPYPGYHMLVVIGYTKDKIITNDNGTRHGKNFSYDNQIFYDAMMAAGGDIVVIKTKTTTP